LADDSKVQYKLDPIKTKELVDVNNVPVLAPAGDFVELFKLGVPLLFNFTSLALSSMLSFAS
jgi:hypothetical protein